MSARPPHLTGGDGPDTRLDSSLPDPNRSRAVLIGASRFVDPELPELPAVQNNVRDLAECLADPDLWGLPWRNCTVVTDPVLPDDVIDPVHQAAAEADDLLLVYYAGHGLIDHETNELLLAVANSRSGHSHKTARYEYVRRAVRETRATRKVVILDCCYSGRAVDGMANPTAAVADGANVMGTYLLASAPANRQALSPAGERHTAFTGELLKLFNTGSPTEGKLLQLDAIYRNVNHTLRARSRPAPQKRAGNTAGDLALVRNRHWLRPAPPPEPQPELDRKTAVKALPLPTYRPGQLSVHRPAPEIPARDTTPARVLKPGSGRESIKEQIRAAGMYGSYECPFCGTAVSAYNLVRHLDRQHAKQLRALEAANTPPDETGFNSAREYIKHQLRADGLYGAYRCPECTDTVMAENLLKHLDKQHPKQLRSRHPASITLRRVRTGSTGTG